MDVSLAQGSPEEKYLLIELPESFIDDEKVRRGSLNIKATEDSSEAFICSESETYSLRHVRQSNTVLITRPITSPSNGCNIESIANIPDYVECLPAKPSISLRGKLPVYRGRHLEASRTKESMDVSLDQLMDLIPLSRKQFQELWIQYMGVELNGKAFLLSQDLAASIISYALETCIALSLSIREIRFEELSHRFQEFEEPLDVCKSALGKFSLDKQESSDVYELNLPSIVQWYGIRALDLYAKTPIPLLVFQQRWKSSFPEHEGLDPDLSQLTGYYVLVKNSQIQALSKDKLPTDIPGRFQTLFSFKPTWQLEEIAPFLEPVYNGKVKLESFIMKYAKKKSIGSKVIVTAR